jgi:hypothetical protein
MEKYLYLTPDEYEAMVCISGQTPVTCFSKMKYLEIEDRRNRLLTLYNKGFVVNTGEAFVINAEWKDAFACIHSAKSALHITAGNPEVPDLIVYVGKSCVLLENISTKTESNYRLSFWESAALAQMLADSDHFPKIRVEQSEADILRRSDDSVMPEDGAEKIECSITKYANGSEDALFSAGFLKKELLWYVMKNSGDAKSMKLADSGTVTGILHQILDVRLPL